MRRLWLLALLAGPVARAADAPELPEAWENASDGAASDARWWTTFGDPLLEAVVDEVLLENRDLRSAWSRLEQAKAAGIIAQSGLWPQIAFDAQAQWAPTKNLGFSFGGNFPLPSTLPDLYMNGSAGFSASWNLDLFGKQYTAWRASRYDALAADGDKNALAMTLAALAVEAYYDVLWGREQVAVLERQQQANADLLSVTELQWESGAATVLDVLQQRQQVEAVATRLPGARLFLRSAEYRLAVLMNRPALDGVEVGVTFPELDRPPEAGVPADLVTTRPDLQAAEARVDAAHKREVSAVLGTLPQVRVGANVGWQFNDFGTFNSTNNWGLSAGITVPLFLGGTHWGNVKQARAGEDAAARTYRSGLLTALSEVETALVADRERREEYAAYVRQRSAARAAYEESVARYSVGITPYVAVLLAQNTLQAAELGALQSRRQTITARVQLHDALGGTWTADLEEPERRTP